MEGKEIRGIIGGIHKVAETFAYLADRRPWFTFFATLLLGGLFSVAGTLITVSYFGDKATIASLNKQIEHERRIQEVERRLADCENDRRTLHQRFQVIVEQLKARTGP